MFSCVTSIEVVVKFFSSWNRFPLSSDHRHPFQLFHLSDGSLIRFYSQTGRTKIHFGFAYSLYCTLIAISSVFYLDEMNSLHHYYQDQHKILRKEILRYLLEFK